MVLNVLQVRSIVFLVFSFIFTFLQSQEITPLLKIKTSGAITDFIFSDSKIILSTDAGTLETYSLDGHKLHIYQLPMMKDFMGEPIPAKIFSIDKFSQQIMMVTQGDHGFRNVLIWNDGIFDTIISAKTDKMMIKKARYIDNTNILFGLMSNELVLFNLLKKGAAYTFYISPYTFSDFYLSDKRAFVYTSDESGIVHHIDVSQGVAIKNFTKNNVDNVYQLVYQNGTIITAGQDRRVGIYQTFFNQQYYLQNDFLVYSVGLNKDGTIGAYSANEENDIIIFNTLTKNELATLKGHQSTISKIEFIDNHTIISASDDHYLMIWKIDY